MEGQRGLHKGHLEAPGNKGQEVAGLEEESLDLVEAVPSYPGEAGDNPGEGQMEAGLEEGGSLAEDDQSRQGVVGDLRSLPPGHHRDRRPLGQGLPQEADAPDTPDLDYRPQSPPEAAQEAPAVWPGSTPWLDCTPGLLHRPRSTSAAEEHSAVQTAQA